jgi:hypothetical protein
MDQVLCLPKYKMTVDLKDTPSQSAIFIKIPIQNMFNFVCS